MQENAHEQSPKPKKQIETPAEASGPPQTLVIHDEEQDMTVNPKLKHNNDSLALLSDFRKNGSKVMFPPITSTV
jgi:hypothetical protein